MLRRSELLQPFRLRAASPDCIQLIAHLPGRAGTGAAGGGVQHRGPTVSVGASVKTLRMNPAGTVAVRIGSISGLFDFEAVEECLYIGIRTLRADAAFGGVKEA